MRSHTSWSIGLGRWGGQHVRLHMFFLLFAVCTFFFAWQAGHDLVWIAAGSLGILLISVLLHELGHYFAAVRTGGDGDEIVIGPFGGMTSMRPPPDPFAECLMHLAGPLVNLTICLMCGTVLQVWSPGSVIGLLDPLAPRDLVDGDTTWIVTLKLTFWINWVMMLANLLPAFPFDGGRALRAALTGWWPDANPRRAAIFVAALAKFASFALLVFAGLHEYFSPAAKTPLRIPIWFSLALLAIFLYFSAKHEEDRVEETESEDDVFGFDFSEGFMSLDQNSKPRPPHEGPFKRWLERKRSEKLRRQAETEQEEERLVDEILERLHAKGMDHVSHDEQLLLKRVSHRYRQRNRQ